MATNKGVYYFPKEKEHELFYSCSSQERRCVGHLRGYFSGDRFYTVWFPHENEEKLNNERFKSEFYPLMDSMMDAEFKSKTNAGILWRCAQPLEEAAMMNPRGVKLMSDHYEYYIRVPEYVGADYIYIYCYEREEC